MEPSGAAGSGAAEDQASSPREAAEARPAGATTRARGGRPRRDDVTTIQHRGITALLTQPSMAAAAAEIGVHPRSLSRWFEEPAFAAEYEAQASELQQELWRRMLGVRGEVWDRFLELVRSKDERVALRATTWLLGRMLSQPPVRRAAGDEEERAIPPRLRELLYGTGTLGAGPGGDVA